jgi:hypothetical protein
MNFIWTDELVLELLKKEIGKEIPASLLTDFKSSKSILPTNATITYVYDNDGDKISAALLTTNCLVQRIGHDSFTIEPTIETCECNGAIFSVGDIVYNNFNYKKYGGKWSNYAVKIETLDLRVRKSGDKVVSSLLLINNFYEVNKFIKK